MADKIPGHIKEWQSLRKKAKKIADTTAHEHSSAYLKASDKHLKDKEGNIDYDMLDDVKVQDKFIDSMTDHYVSKAKQHFKAKGGGKLKDDLLMSSYAGITSDMLKNIIQKKGSGYNLQNHEGLKEELIKKTKEQLEGIAGGHLKDQHIGDIVKYVKADNLVDHKKMNLQDAMHVHSIYDQKGKVLSKKMLEKELGKDTSYIK